ncbi:MAG TPA: hypothetical protein PKZ08_11610 [Vicinamibacterales bacterium]|nr:hypothetical protein [Vicinamibacterales bacterium]
MPTNDARHTPGPWKAVEAAYNPPGWLWVQNGPGALLADVHQNVNIPLDARNANARLMAAAPELLEALQEIITAADGEGWSQLDAGFTKARAAVAKALGND